MVEFTLASLKIKKKNNNSSIKHFIPVSLLECFILSWLEIDPVVPEKTFVKVNVFDDAAIISSWKGRVPTFLYPRNLVENGQVVLEMRKIWKVYKQTDRQTRLRKGFSTIMYVLRIHTWEWSNLACYIHKWITN